MKRLITILLSFIGCVSLYGQGVPMVVAGDVYVNGPMRSQGSVNVYAETGTGTNVDTGKVYISTTGMLATDTLVFYSNDKNDGLLKNVNPSGVQGHVSDATPSGSPSKVIVRKTFSKGNVTPPVFTYFSLPFSVAPISILKAGTSDVLSYVDNATGYGVWGFDALARTAYRGYDSTNVWKEIVYLTDSVKAGKGYQFWYGPGGDVDFVTTDQAAIKQIFDPADKSVNYTMYTLANAQDVHQQPMDEGWAFIGGLNSTTYTLNNATVKGYNTSAPAATIYVRKSVVSTANGAQGGGTPTGGGTADSYIDVLVGVPGNAVNINPYSPFYIQGNSSNVPSPTGTPATFTFAYDANALLLDKGQYRSSQAESGPQDQLYFALSSDKDNSFDRFYLNFADNYTESYKAATEDAVKMSTVFGDRPAVWSIMDGTDASLVVSGLPMKDERKVQMGFSVPEAGDYTISLDPLRQQDVKSVVLVDNVTGKKVDLLQSPYSFSSGAVDNENGRFALYINSSYTNIPSISSTGIYAFVKDNVLTVKNLSEGDRVQVLDLSGRTVASGKASGKEFSTALSLKGVYVVNVTGGKASVLKVLNK